jgi:hypothetical protein
MTGWKGQPVVQSVRPKTAKGKAGPTHPDNTRDIARAVQQNAVAEYEDLTGRSYGSFDLIPVLLNHEGTTSDPVVSRTIEREDEARRIAHNLQRAMNDAFEFVASNLGVRVGRAGHELDGPEGALAFFVRNVLARAYDLEKEAAHNPKLRFPLAPNRRHLGLGKIIGSRYARTVRQGIVKAYWHRMDVLGFPTDSKPYQRARHLALVCILEGFATPRVGENEVKSPALIIKGEALAILSSAKQLGLATTDQAKRKARTSHQ